MLLMYIKSIPEVPGTEITSLNIASPLSMGRFKSGIRHSLYFLVNSV